VETGIIVAIPMNTTCEISRRTIVRSLVLASVGAATLRGALRRGEAAPHFSARTLGGEKLTSDSLKGQVVLIQFWATWCQYCKRDETAVEALLKEFGKQGLVVLAVDMGEPRHKVKKYLEGSPRSVKIVLADDTTLAAICEAKSYPLYVLIDREGMIAGVQHGAGGEDALRDLLGQAGLESAG
jgi:peroxiredoxin